MGRTARGLSHMGTDEAAHAAQPTSNTLCADPGEPAGKLSKYMYLTGHAYFLCVAYCQL